MLWRFFLSCSPSEVTGVNIQYLRCLKFLIVIRCLFYFRKRGCIFLAVVVPEFNIGIPLWFYQGNTLFEYCTGLEII